MRNLIKIAFVALSLVLLLKTGDAMAASSCNSTYCRVEPSDTLTIDAHGTCYDISNYPPNIPIYVPIKTSAEWANFYNHLPSNVTKDSCDPGYSEGEYYSEGTYGPAYSEGYYPPAYSEGYYPPSYSEGYYPPAYSEGYYPPTYSEGYYPPVYSEGYYPPVYSEGYYPPVYSEGYYPPVYSEGYYPPTYSEGYYPPVYSESGYYSQGGYYSESSYDEGTCDPLQGPGSYSCECTEICDVYSELNTNPDALCDCGGATCVLTCGE
ncbi:MAG TPA: hypothetical protein VGE35_00395 [Candidatus Paceibacterota bacterium]